MNLENRTIEILAQVVYKELCEDRRVNNPAVLEEQEAFWKVHKEDTLELARNILRVQRTINPAEAGEGRI